tara:strand:- start:2135 stop:2446 length:312 start_codon:yes stop_codon:yes gene_type:complete
MYEEGTIKLTWINPKDFTRLESKMFSKDELNNAVEEGKKLGKFMIFKLETTSNDEYTWKLLDYGQSKDFVRSMQFRESPMSKLLVGGILALAIYGGYKLIKRN